LSKELFASEVAILCTSEFPQALLKIWLELFTGNKSLFISFLVDGKKKVLLEEFFVAFEQGGKHRLRSEGRSGRGVHAGLHLNHFI